MSAIADRYRQLADRFNRVVESVPAGAWDAPSPCDGWTARDVVGHVVSTEKDFLEGRSLLPAGLDLPSDPAAAWPVIRDVVQGILDDPTAATTGYEGWFGPTTVEQTLDTFYAFDLIIHAWDLFKATGASGYEPMPPDEIERIQAQMAGFGEMLRSPGVCGPEVPAPADATAEQKLLAFLGRNPF